MHILVAMVLIALLVSQTPTSLTVTPVKINYNTYNYLTATLKNTIHNVAISKPLNFYVNGILVGTSAGSLYVMGLNPGTYSFFAELIENNGFKLWIDYPYEPVSNLTNI